jgi:hypothetical protein
MWTIWLMVGVGLPLIIWGLWAVWHNNQVDKYNEWKKQQEALGNTPESV